MGINDISGSTYKDIKNLANDLGVELKFSYKRGYSKHSTAKIPLENILVEHSPYKSLSKIRNRLIKEGLKEHRCEYVVTMNGMVDQYHYSCITLMVILLTIG